MCVRIKSPPMTTIVHISDLHFGRPAASGRLEALKSSIPALEPDAVAVSGDLTQRCTHREFEEAKAYLDDIEKVAPYIVIPGNHDIRWLGAVVRNIGGAGLLQKKAHDFKYSRYKNHISEDLNPSLRVPGDPEVVIAAMNTSHGVIRGSLTTRIKDIGVIGRVRRKDVGRAREVFENAPEGAVRVAMIHHNPLRGEVSGRHGLANTKNALRAFGLMGAEVVLCGHDHQDAVHNVEEYAPGLVISTAGTISDRERPGRASSFNVVEVDGENIHVTTHSWREGSGFEPSRETSFSRRPRRGA